jgi:general secretion pathway protein J
MSVRSFARTGLAQSGFTLIEIMVALVVMSIIMVLAYQAFDGILLMEERSKDDFLKENRRSLATSILLNDFFHMRARPVRDQLGGIREAYLAPSGDYAVEFTRGALPNVEYMAGGIQRVAYSVKNKQLVRTIWETVDVGPATDTIDQVIASGIASIDVEQLDEDGRFIPNWPPINRNLAEDALPPMVKVILETEEGDQLELLVPGPQVENRIRGERDL